jgi:hypothetical protein
VLVALAGLGLAAGASKAEVVDLTAAERVRASAQIVVATVEDRESHWNPQHTLIFTDYTLRIKDRLKGGDGPNRIAISIPGGTVDGETHRTSVSLELAPGSRYLLFLEDLEHPTFTPVVGAWQGALREAPPDLVEAVRSLVARVAVSGSPEPPEKRREEPRPPLPAKEYDPAPAPPLREKYVYQDSPAAPIVINQFPLSFPFSPYDQHQMAYWNIYGRNLFRVLSNPTGRWAFRNGVFDLAGFPDDADLRQQFGRGWGSGVLALTFTLLEGRRIVEADVALNPAFAWTVDEREATRVEGGSYSFNQTMLHELGHVWGLKHPWEVQDVWWDSVMNDAPKEYRLTRLFTDDASAARRAYPGLKLRDALVSSYVTQDVPGDLKPAYVPARPVSGTVKAGSPLKMRGSIKIENVGTVKIARPQVEVYLTPERLSSAGAVYLGTMRTDSVVKPTGILRVSLEAGTFLKVPRNARAGRYYLAFHLRDPKDGYQDNNWAWSNSNVTVRVTAK